MEDMKSRGASKPPLYTNFKSSINLPPLRMMLPSTLSKAFENSPYCMNIPSGAGAGAGKSVAISAEKVVDLNIPPSPHANHEGEEMNINKIEKNSPFISKKCPINQGVESGSSSKGKRIMTLDEAIQNEKNGRDIPLEDERKLRRTVSNRLSAQRSRLKRSQYIAELHKKIKDLQENVAFLTPKLDSCRQSHTMLKMEKTIIEQQLKSCINKSTLCNREIEKKKAEIRRLKYLYKAQKEEMTMSPAAPCNAESSTSLPSYPPENNYQRGVSSNYRFFQNEPWPAVVEVSTDQGGIEQYLNLDALGVSSTQAQQM